MSEKSFIAQINSHLLFPTPLLTLEFDKVENLNSQLINLFETDADYQGEDSLKNADLSNLLNKSSQYPVLNELRQMFFLA